MNRFRNIYRKQWSESHLNFTIVILCHYFNTYWILFLPITIMSKTFSISKLALFVATLLLMIDCRTLYYIKNSQPFEYYQCLRKIGLETIMLPLVSTRSGVQQDSFRNIISARSAGLDVQVTFIPCRYRSVNQELQLITQNFKPGSLTGFWAYPLAWQSQCSWDNFSAQSNCKYLQNLISTVEKKYKSHIDIVADKKSWAQLFNSTSGCQNVSNALLWWIPTDQQTSSQPNFNSYQQIGGWKTPSMKLSNTESICGEEVLEIFYA